MPPLFSTLPVTSNTRYVTTGSTFVAIKGMKEDGVAYIPQALAAGAQTIVIQQDVVLSAAIQELLHAHAAKLVRVADTRRALAELSAQAQGYPAHKLTMIGISGTKGKSTTTFLVEHMLRTAGYKTAMLSTIYNKILDVVYETELTTQHPDYLHAFLATCVGQGVTHVVVEVAAQALSLHRVATLQFDVVMFLNFSHEHGEFYATQDAYFAAKAQLFTHLKSQGIAIVPHEDARITAAAYSAGISDNLLRTFATTFAITGDVVAKRLTGITFVQQQTAYTIPALVGNFNIHNARAALLAARWCGVSEAAAQAAFLTFTPVPGRCNSYQLPNGAQALIDYAHNPASFEQIFKMVRPCTQHLLVVFGAGGDRDVAKRPLMGALAAQYADGIIITTDNPRSEDPAVIIAAIKAGIPEDARARVLVEPDREQAIRAAYALSGPETVILLLGKGPDEYQLVKGVKTYFSEREILQSLATEIPARAMHLES